MTPFQGSRFPLAGTPTLSLVLQPSPWYSDLCLTVTPTPFQHIPPCAMRITLLLLLVLLLVVLLLLLVVVVLLVLLLGQCPNAGCD